MKTIIVIVSLIISFQAYGKVSEKEINSTMNIIYCSAFLEYIDSGVQDEQIKAEKLIKKAEEINASLLSGYRSHVIADRDRYIAKLGESQLPKEVVRATYDNLKCDLKI